MIDFRVPPVDVEGAELLGDTVLVVGLRQAASPFGTAYPRDRDARHEILHRLPRESDRYWAELDDAVYPQLEALMLAGLGGYIRRHPEAFFLPN